MIQTIAQAVNQVIGVAVARAVTQKFVRDKTTLNNKTESLIQSITAH